MKTIFSTLGLLLLISSTLSAQLFTAIPVTVQQLNNSSAAWGDYDNDGDLDLVLAGENANTSPLIKIYENQDGDFQDISASLPGLSNGSAEWGDYDSDGDLDLLITGRDEQLVATSMIFLNDNGTFVDSGIALPGIMGGEASWGDYDNDGWLDIILTGRIVGCGGLATTMLFRNETFLNFFIESSLIPGYNQGDVNWGDFNNDGYTDLVFTGLDGFGVPTTRIYSNNLGIGVFTTNTPPEMPEGLSASTSGE